MKIIEIWDSTCKKCQIPIGIKGCAIKNKQEGMNKLTYHKTRGYPIINRIIETEGCIFNI